MDLDDLLPALSLLATLRTAAETKHAIAERRAGRDPSRQETSADARAALTEAQDELAELLTRMRTLRTYTVFGPRESVQLRSVRHFDALMTGARVERLLQRIHQHLLSLYPNGPDATLVEDARRLHGCAKALLDDEGDREGAVPSAFLDDALQFMDALDDQLP